MTAVTTGGGKSLLLVLAAARLIAAGVAERVCWVVPRDSLPPQAEEAFADPAWRAALPHTLSVSDVLLITPGQGSPEASGP